MERHTARARTTILVLCSDGHLPVLGGGEGGYFQKGHGTRDQGRDPGQEIMSYAPCGQTHTCETSTFPIQCCQSQSNVTTCSVHFTDGIRLNTIMLPQVCTKECAALRMSTKSKPSSLTYTYQVSKVGNVHVLDVPLCSNVFK